MQVSMLEYGNVGLNVQIWLMPQMHDTSQPDAARGKGSESWLKSKIDTTS